jgi:hypothetical protein
MRLPRMTIRTFMVAVVIIAIDCVFLIDGAFSGLLVPVLALNLGLFRLTRAGDRGRRFWTGFVVTDLLAVAGYVALGYVAEEAVAQWPAPLLNGVISRLPGDAALAVDRNLTLFLGESLLAQVVLLETTVGVPLVLLAVAGGWIGRAVRPSRATRLLSVGPSTAVGGSGEV